MTTIEDKENGLANQQMRGLTEIGEGEFFPEGFAFAEAPVERCRWATTRTATVDHVREAWSNQPDLIRVFEDPRLGRAELVMLRKDRFDRLVEILNQLAAGQAGVKVDVEGLAQVQIALQSAAGSHSTSPAIESLVKLVATFVGKIKSSIVMVNKFQQPNRSQIVDAATLEFLAEEEEQEMSVDDSSR